MRVRAGKRETENGKRKARYACQREGVRWKQAGKRETENGKRETNDERPFGVRGYAQDEP